MPSRIGAQNTTSPVGMVLTQADLPKIFEIGQTPDYFRLKWGNPQVNFFNKNNMTWTQGNLRASVTFNENRAEKIDYTLPTGNWSDAQVTAALEANGTGWKEDVSTTDAISHALVQGMLSIRQGKWISDQGCDATLVAATMTIRSADLVNAEAAKKLADEANKKAVPNF